jgi:hypothetical protein
MPRSTRHVAKIGFGVVPQSVNCDGIVCRISVGLEHSLRPRPAHPVVPKGSRTPSYGWGFVFSGPGKPAGKSARRTAQPTTPVMIAMMKPIAPSQSKSPTSVPRLAEKSGSMLLFMFGLWSMKATNDGAPIRFLRAGRVTSFSLEIRGGMVRNPIGDPGELLILRRDRRFESAFL